MNLSAAEMEELLWWAKAFVAIANILFLYVLIGKHEMW